MVDIQQNKMKNFIGILVIFLNLVACGQSSSSKSNTEDMNLSKITNENVKNAIEALQSGNEAW